VRHIKEERREDENELKALHIRKHIDMMSVADLGSILFFLRNGFHKNAKG